MSAGFDLPGITNPITHAGRVVYNADRDATEQHRRLTKMRRAKDGTSTLYKQSHHVDENFTIQPYELCLRNKNTSYISYTPNDTDMHVFSSANGMFGEDSNGNPVRQLIKGDDDNNANKVADARQSLDFAGVASNRSIYDPNNNANEDILAIQVGGLQTIYNNSDEEINAGDIVLWDLPTTHDGRPSKPIPGVPRNKILFVTSKYKAINNLEEHQDQARRVIGKALSHAKKGKPFDILLGHYCV